MGRFRDLTGQTFGMLKAVTRAENSKTGETMWNCICECGNEITVLSASLIAGDTKSCGCLRMLNSDISMIGKKFGRLNVIERSEKDKHGDYKWKCLCDCGEIVYIRGGSLRGNITLSCGCYHKENQSNRKRMGVYLKGDKYCAYIWIGKKQYYLGWYTTLEDASRIRKKAEEKRKAGEFIEWFYETFPKRKRI